VTTITPINKDNDVNTNINKNIEISTNNDDIKNNLNNNIKQRRLMLGDTLCEFCGVIINDTQFCCSSCAKIKFSKYQDPQRSIYHKHYKPIIYSNNKYKIT